MLSTYGALLSTRTNDWRGSLIDGDLLSTRRCLSLAFLGGSPHGCSGELENFRLECSIRGG
jgi:hypothetical protein